MVTFGDSWANDVGACVPAVHQFANGAFVAYGRECPDGNGCGGVGGNTSCTFHFHRLTSPDGTIWTEDTAFNFVADGTRYASTHGVGSIFVVSDTKFIYNYLGYAQDAGSCPIDAKWYWAESSTGTGASGGFADETGAKHWWIDQGGGTPVPACNISNPFFLVDAGHVRVYFYNTVAASWYTAVSTFML